SSSDITHLQRFFLRAVAAEFCGADFLGLLESSGSRRRARRDVRVRASSQRWTPWVRASSRDVVARFTSRGIFQVSLQLRNAQDLVRAALQYSCNISVVSNCDSRASDVVWTWI